MELQEISVKVCIHKIVIINSVIIQFVFMLMEFLADFGKKIKLNKIHITLR
jgi:hypothetical protein